MDYGRFSDLLSASDLGVAATGSIVAVRSKAIGPLYIGSSGPAILQVTLAISLFLWLDLGAFFSLLYFIVVHRVKLCEHQKGLRLAMKQLLRGSPIYTIVVA